MVMVWLLNEFTDKEKTRGEVKLTNTEEYPKLYKAIKRNFK